jgi:hypothetical protein
MNIKRAIKLLIINLSLILITSSRILGDGMPYTPPPIYQPYTAENQSYRGQISKRTHRPKDVHVKRYTRKDGTRVRGHYKSRRR